MYVCDAFMERRRLVANRGEEDLDFFSPFFFFFFFSTISIRCKYIYIYMFIYVCVMYARCEKKKRYIYILRCNNGQLRGWREKNSESEFTWFNVRRFVGRRIVDYGEINSLAGR